MTGALLTIQVGSRYLRGLWIYQEAGMPCDSWIRPFVADFDEPTAHTAGTGGQSRTRDPIRMTHSGAWDIPTPPTADEPRVPSRRRRAVINDRPVYCGIHVSTFGFLMSVAFSGNKRLPSRDRPCPLALP